MSSNIVVNVISMFDKHLSKKKVSFAALLTGLISVLCGENTLILETHSRHSPERAQSIEASSSRVELECSTEPVLRMFSVFIVITLQTYTEESSKLISMTKVAWNRQRMTSKHNMEIGLETLSSNKRANTTQIY